MYACMVRSIILHKTCLYVRAMHSMEGEPRCHLYIARKVKTRLLDVP
jgi:hypothetical protein